MTDEVKKSLYTEEEMEKFRDWAVDVEASGKKVTVRACKEYMLCGQVKANALMQQFVDEKTRGAIEKAMTVDVPDNVLNAISEYMNGEIKKIVEQLRNQIKEAEARANESSEKLEAAQQSAEYMTAERDRINAECIEFKAKLDVLERELAEYKKRCDKLTEALQASKVEAAAAKASLDTLKDTLKTEKTVD